MHYDLLLLAGKQNRLHIEDVNNKRKETDHESFDNSDVDNRSLHCLFFEKVCKDKRWLDVSGCMLRRVCNLPYREFHTSYNQNSSIHIACIGSWNSRLLGNYSTKLIILFKAG